MRLEHVRTQLVWPLALVAGACRVGPDYEPPDLSARTEAPWRATAEQEVPEERVELASWWRRLGSAELDGLAEELVRQNLSLGEARARVAAARALRDAAGAGRRPRLDADATYVRAGTGDESLNFQGPPPGSDVDVWSVGMAAAWELDLWGRVAREAEAAEAELQAAALEERSATVALLARLSLAYVDATTLRARLDVLQRDVAAAEETVRLARSRLEAGNGTRVALEQAEGDLALARARVPDLERGRRAAENRIALLLGERPAEGRVRAEDELTTPALPGLGLPADLLARRADLRAAERRLAAAVARVGAAEAERYPSVSITGRVALAAMEPGTLTGGDALSYSVGPGLVVPLLTGGRVEAAVHLGEARAEEARLAFERALLEAVGEVEDAADAAARARRSGQRLEAALAAARAAADLFAERHASGLDGLLPLLGARRAALALEDALLLARRAELVATIDLYRALGGGWEALGPDGAVRSEAAEPHEDAP